MNQEEIKTIEEVNGLLSKALWDVSRRKISLKQAQVVSRIASQIARNIERTDLKKRIELLESVMGNKNR